MLVLTFPGGQALSEHSLGRLNVALRAVGEAQLAGVRHLHFVDCERALDKTEEQRLLELLDYAPAAGTLSDGPSVLTVPRFGTISPWSSKATEIARNCALDMVRRVERGVEYRFQEGGSVLSTQTDLLHDRMIESVLTDLAEAPRLFEEGEATPLAHIQLGDDPAQALMAANQQYGLALSEKDIEYLVRRVSRSGPGPE